MFGSGIKIEQRQIDRRSRRSRNLIADALFALMHVKRYDRITVQEIIDRADVGRSTFYAHFRSKEDVLQCSIGAMLERLQTELVAAEEAPAGQLLPSLGLFRHVAEVEPAFHALVRVGGVDTIHEALRRALREHVERRLAALLREGCTPQVPSEILAEYVSGSFLSLLFWWLERGMPYSAEEMDAIFQRLASPGVRRALRPGAGPTK